MCLENLNHVDTWSYDRHGYCWMPWIWRGSYSYWTTSYGDHPLTQKDSIPIFINNTWAFNPLTILFNSLHARGTISLHLCRTKSCMLYKGRFWVTWSESAWFWGATYLHSLLVASKALALLEGWSDGEYMPQLYLPLYMITIALHSL